MSVGIPGRQVIAKCHHLGPEPAEPPPVLGKNLPHFSIGHMGKVQADCVAICLPGSPEIRLDPGICLAAMGTPYRGSCPNGEGPAAGALCTSALHEAASFLNL